MSRNGTGGTGGKRGSWEVGRSELIEVKGFAELEKKHKAKSDEAWKLGGLEAAKLEGDRLRSLLSSLGLLG
jgi:hypothetical protein